MRSWLQISLLVLLASEAFEADALDAASPEFRVIVHPNNPANGLSKDFLADIFLKKVTRWPNGELVRPVDLVQKSPVRQHFVLNVLNRSLAAVRNYWHQRLFSGRDLPPPEMSSDEEVVRYVLRHPGAVGYVSPAADIGTAKFVDVN